jgi:hypothetical protein
MEQVSSWSNPLIRPVIWGTSCARFYAWYNANQDTSWTKNLPECPCSIMRGGRCRITVGGEIYYEQSGGSFPHIVNPDPTIWQDPSSSALWGPQLILGKLHPGAVYDMRTRPKPEYGGAGQQCTYDAKGHLITHGPGAGTADKVGPGSPGSHGDEDVEPFLWARECDGGTMGHCVDMYLQVRPPDSKNNCPKNPPVPPSPGKPNVR